LLSITAFLSGLTRKKTEDRGGGHSKEAYFIQWGVVENKYREKAVKIPIQYFTNWIGKSSSFIPNSKYFSVKWLKS
jgi:hypothetical protein